MPTVSIRLIAAIVALLNCIVSGPVHADPQPARSYRHPRSACVVTSSAGEYPLFTVLRSGNPIFAPPSDGIRAVVFSPAGRFVALVGSEIDGIQAPNPKSGVYGVVVVDCLRGAATGFLEPYRSGTLRWTSDTAFTFTLSENGVVYEQRVGRN